MSTIDDKDRQILAIVQRDARLPQAEVGRRVGLSTAAVNERLKKLEQRGIITGYAALVDPERIGCDITAFVEIFIEHPKYESDFVARMKEIPEVQEVHHVTGEFSCLLKVKVWNRRELQRLLLGEINSLPGVRQTRTVIALSTSKEDFQIPLAASSADREPNGAADRASALNQPSTARGADAGSRRGDVAQRAPSSARSDAGPLRPQAREAKETTP
jgi:Lrp/AsnC family transcriptional regulator, leucine-responsive regulatory protein